VYMRAFLPIRNLALLAVGLVGKQLSKSRHMSYLNFTLRVDG